MGFTVQEGIPVITVFLQGLLSFFSPCVLPLLPVYLGYLSGGTLAEDEDGNVTCNRKKVLVNTVCFVLGISFAFFALGFGMTAVGRFFSGNRILFARIGGVIVILFGLYQLGVLGDSRLLSRERKLPLDLDRLTMSPLTAFLMGFVFSFAWTPCVGPALSGVLLMASSASSSAKGFLLIGVYTLGYVIPFLLAGLFTASLLRFFGKHRGIVRYTAKIGGVLLILMGILMFTGKMNTVTGYLSSISATTPAAEASVSELEETSVPKETAAPEKQPEPPEETLAKPKPAASVPEETAAPEKQPEPQDEVPDEPEPAPEAGTEPEEDDRFQAPAFTLADQNGETHTLSDYLGKIVFLNFWATWCPPCRAELPYIQELYEENPDVAVIGIVCPDMGQEQNEAGIRRFLDENGLTYPVLMDRNAEATYLYGISVYPTTFLIDPEGYLLGYVPGSMTKSIMESILAQAREMSGLQPEQE